MGGPQVVGAAHRAILARDLPAAKAKVPKAQARSGGAAQGQLSMKEKLIAAAEFWWDWVRRNDKALMLRQWQEAVGILQRLGDKRKISKIGGLVKFVQTKE